MPNKIRVRKKAFQPRHANLQKKAFVDNPLHKPKRGFVRRIFGLLFNRYTISIGFLVFLGASLTFAYFWTEYSDRVDMLLRGEIFTKHAGIYSAPKILKDGEGISRDELVTYLQSAGYIEKNRQADESRSRYLVDGDSVEITPGETAQIDDKKSFPGLKVRFDKEGKSVAAVTDLDTKKDVPQAKLEPMILNSIAAEGSGRRKTVAFTDLPPNLIKAITVTEDRAFFEHYGVNFRGIARALWRRYERDDNSPVARQGGSSITQQLVKNLLLSSDQTLERKAKEAMMSVILETRLSKEEIFTLYSNQIYLGQQAGGVGIYGVGEAANVYFGKDVSALNLGESAFIAGIIRSPNRYNPFKTLEKVTERRNQVLLSMLEAGTINEQDFTNAKGAQVVLHQSAERKEMPGMPYFSQYVVEEIPKYVNDPEAMQHLRIYTSIDPDLQKAANQAVIDRLEKLDKLFPKKPKGTLQAALIAIRPKTGEIVAMVGGRNYQDNQFNRATDAMRQPGSVFKPFVYATAINSAYESSARVFTAATTFKDEKKTFMFNHESYSPNNYGDFFSNKDLTLRESLVKSKNTITVDLAMQLNVGRVMNLAAKAGFPKVERAFPSMALGTAEATPLEVATAYTTFANMGDRVLPLPITKVTTGEGKTVVAPVADKKTVLRPDVAYIMNDMMKDVINIGTASSAQAWGFKNAPGKFGYAGKTGTSRDGWFAGFTPDLVCVVYVGFDENDELGMKGADSALPIWADFMRQALNLHPEWNGDWTMPDNIRKAEIDTRDGHVIRELDPKEAELIEAQHRVIKDKKNSEALPVLADGSDVVSIVPSEFRRIELFINGSIPVDLSPKDDLGLDDKLPEATPTPFKTWEDAHQQDKTESLPIKKPGDKDSEKNKPKATITIMVCPLSGQRATLNCPEKEPKTFEMSKEPKDFCDLHRQPPK